MDSSEESSDSSQDNEKEKVRRPAPPKRTMTTRSMVRKPAASQDGRGNRKRSLSSLSWSSLYGNKSKKTAVGKPAIQSKCKISKSRGTQNRAPKPSTSNSTPGPTGISTQAPGPPIAVNQVPGPSTSIVQTQPVPIKYDRQLIIGPSNIHGWGVFTTNALRKDEVLVEYVGEIISEEVAHERQRYNFEKTYLIVFDKDKYIDGSKSGNCSRYINHSCEPNCVVTTSSVLNSWRILILSSRQIDRGEELTINYHLSAGELIPCNCGWSKCRGFMNTPENARAIRRKEAKKKGKDQRKDG